MPYLYEAFNASGQRVKGTVDADAEAQVEQWLWNQGLTVVKLKRVGKPFALHEQLPTFFGVKSSDVIAFAEQLAIMIEAGVNMYMALKIMRDQTRKPAFRAVLSSVLEDIAGGQTLTEACGRHPRAFSNFFLRLLKVGEETGRLDVMLRRVAEYMTKQSEAGSKVKGAMTYPIIVICTAAISMYVLMAVALPNLIGLFKEFKAELPMVTRMVIASVNLAGDYGSYGLLGVVALVAGFVMYSRTRVGKRNIDYWLAGMPVMGDLIVKLNLSRMGDTMATLVSSGISMTESLNLLVDITHNAALREPLQDVRENALTGSGLADAMSRHPVFPPMMVNLTRIGEETGSLEMTFHTLGRMYGAEVDRNITRLIALLEPMMTIVVGGAIGLVSVTIISTIYSIMPQIK